MLLLFNVLLRVSISFPVLLTCHGTYIHWHSVVGGWLCLCAAMHAIVVSWSVQVSRFGVKSSPIESIM